MNNFDLENTKEDLQYNLENFQQEYINALEPVFKYLEYLQYRITTLEKSLEAANIDFVENTDID